MADPWDLVSTVAPSAAAPSVWDAVSAPVAATSGVTQGKTAPLRIQMGNPEPQPAQPVSPVWDFIRSIPGGALSGLSNAASAGGQAAQLEMGQPVDVPSATTTKAALEQNVTGTLPEPQGSAGKFGATIGEFLGNPASYVAPGGVLAKAGMATLAGIGSEGAGQVAEGTPYEGIARFGGAVIGGGIGAGIANRANVAATIGKRPSSTATTDALKSAAVDVYESPTIKSVTLEAAPVAEQISSIASDIASQGVHPVLAPKTFGILSEAMNAPKGSVVTVDNLRALRRTLGKAALSPDPTEKMAAQTAVRGVDKILENLSPELKTANANYSAAKKAERLDKRFEDATEDAAAVHSGMNISNKLRQQARTILKSPNLSRGLNADDIKELKSLANGTATRNGLRIVSNILGGGGGAHSFYSGLLTLGVAPAVGFALRHLENVLTVRAANQISEAIRARAPLGKAIENAATDWDKAREALVSGPSSKTFAAFSLASRNLSNNLASAGVRVHPNQLLRSVQGPMDASADEKQQ